MKITIVANPRAGGGRAGRLRELFTQWEGAREQHEVLWTTAPRDAKRLVQAAVDGGARRVIAVGGDGTIHEVVNGLMSLPEHRRVSLGVVPVGTGGDFRRTLGLNDDVHTALKVACEAEPRPLDLMRLAFGDRVVWSMNVVGFGMNGEVVERVNASSKRLGAVSFALATARTVASFRSRKVTVKWSGPEGEGVFEGPLSSAFVSNGRFCGGGMLVGPRSFIDDGVVELTILPDLGVFRMARHAYRLWNGTMSEVDGVISAPITSLQVSSDAPSVTLVDVDGERPGNVPFRLDVSPKAMEICY